MGPPETNWRKIEMKQFKLFGSILVFSLLLAACGPAATSTPEPAPTPEPVADEAMTMDIVDTAIAADGFETLVSAVQAAGLVDALKGEGPFTVFAPTDDAFRSLYSTLGVNGIEDITAETLVPILLYHVVNGNVRAADLSDGEVNTLNGNINFSLSGAVTINGESEVTATDIQGANGVVHVINKVLLPPAE